MILPKYIFNQDIYSRLWSQNIKIYNGTLQSDRGTNDHPLHGGFRAQVDQVHF